MDFAFLIYEQPYPGSHTCSLSLSLGLWALPGLARSILPLKSRKCLRWGLQREYSRSLSLLCTWQFLLVLCITSRTTLRISRNSWARYIFVSLYPSPIKLVLNFISTWVAVFLFPFFFQFYLRFSFAKICNLSFRLLFNRLQCNHRFTLVFYLAFMLDLCFLSKYHPLRPKLRVN